MNKQEVQITYNLSEVNLALRTGVLRVKQAHLSKGNVIQVTLSGGLIAKIKTQIKDAKARKYTNIDYTSTLMSDKYEENPFKLIKFTHPGKPDTFKLQLVTDKGIKWKEYRNAMNQRVDKAIFLYWKPSQFIRFWVVEMDH